MKSNESNIRFSDIKGKRLNMNTMSYSDKYRSITGLAA